MSKIPTCPKCRRAQYFTCGIPGCVCAKHVPKGKLTQIPTSDGGGLICPYCGYAASMDYWEERGIQSLLRYEGVKSFGELDEKRRAANLAGSIDARPSKKASHA